MQFARKLRGSSLFLPVLAVLSLAVGCAARQPSPHWSQLPPVPDREGFAGHFAGVSGGSLLVAGGSNFPDKRPWDGGKKVWYDQVFSLPSPDSRWAVVGRLPRPNAYGVSVTTPDGLLCIGGGDAREHFRDVFCLRLDAGQITVTPLPSLPVPCAFMTGALVGRTVYVAGGVETPASTQCLHSLWSLDLDHAGEGWQYLPPCPGPARILAVAGAANGSFYLFSGASLSAGPDGKPVRRYLRDAWRYSPSSGWVRLPDLPRAAVAAVTPAPLIDQHLIIVSGDDGTHVGFKPETEHPGFPRNLLSYDTRSDEWSTLANCPISRATVPAVVWENQFVLPCGEERPGYRTPEVWGISTGTNR